MKDGDRAKVKKSDKIEQEKETKCQLQMFYCEGVQSFPAESKSVPLTTEPLELNK